MIPIGSVALEAVMDQVGLPAASAAGFPGLQLGKIPSIHLVGGLISAVNETGCVIPQVELEEGFWKSMAGLFCWPGGIGAAGSMFAVCEQHMVVRCGLPLDEQFDLRKNDVP